MTTPIIPTNIHFEKDSLGIGQAAEAVSKSINKLLGTISSAIGIVYEPTRIKRLADAETYKIKALANAQIEAESLGNTELATRIDEVSRMVVAKELRRQDNIAYIVNEAIKQIELKEQVSDEEVDPDWTTRFINIAQDISNEDMKNLWAQILAGEVAKPRTYSLRTLECLKNITKEEAELFVKVSSLVLKFESLPFIINKKELLKNHDINYLDIQKLIEVGLLNTARDTCLDMSKLSNRSLWVKNQKKIGICKSNGRSCEIPIYTFTSAGAEMLNITRISNDDIFFMEVLTEIKKLNCSVEYANIIYDDGNNIRFSSPTIKLS